MILDISNLLDRWDYRPGEVMVRKIKGKDRKTKLQLGDAACPDEPGRPAGRQASQRIRVLL